MSAVGRVRRRAVRGRHTRMVGSLSRLGRCRCECRQPGVQALHLRPPCGHEGSLCQR
jgi:hypothetical protein